MASELDKEIEQLKARVASLRHDLAIQTSTLLSAPSTHTRLRQLAASPAHAPSGLALPQPTTTKPHSREQQLLALAERQAAHAQQGLYRACAGATLFRVRDPDPRAVDGGAVLGLRLEVVVRGRFARPYYVLLNRPWAARAPSAHATGGAAGQAVYLRVHRHTVPPCVPLEGLAARYLPPPPPPRERGDAGEEEEEEEERRRAAGTGDGRGRQDLPRFVRALRKEIVRHHNRIAGVADLRRAVGLAVRKGGKEEEQPRRKRPSADGDGARAIVDISPADPAAKQIKMEWADGRTGRLVLDDDGRVEKLVVLGEDGRDRSLTRWLLRRGMHLDEVVRTLREEPVT